MTTTNLITAAEATKLLGYENRSSLTRLVQAGKIAPAFKASGKSGEEFFNRDDVISLATPTALVSAGESFPQEHPGTRASLSSPPRIEPEPFASGN